MADAFPHDHKYEHPSYKSPGVHPDATVPEVAEYPRVLHAHDPADNVTVATPDEEAEHLKTGRWKRSPADWVTALVVLALVLLGVPAHAQTSVQTTTLSAALSAPAQGAPAQTVLLASATNIAAPTATVPGSELFVDAEAMLVTALSGTTATVTRGYDGTAPAAHASGATVYAGPISGTTGSPYVFSDPGIGTCTASNEVYNYRINTRTGKIWSCTGGYWTNVIDAFMFLPAQYCQSSVSGNSTGTNGYTSLGTAPSIPVVQAQTSGSGTNTHYYMCSLMPDTSRLAPSKSIYVIDAEFYYGVQTNALGTQAATLASGTLNGKTVFTSITYPTPAASQTPTGLAEAARSDSGTLVITPVVGSFNTATTTAGEFYSVKFTPATAIPIATDHGELLLTVSLLGQATSAMITNSPGVLVHYRLINGN